MPNRRAPYLDAVTFHFEGAYREHDPVEPAAYGYNLVNFMRDVPNLWRNLDKTGMHPRVVELMNRVAAGGSGARDAGEALFAGVGQRTTLFAAGRHTDQPINQNADTLNYLESVKRIIRPLTEEKYKHDFGFGNIRDEYIRHEALDSTYIRPHSGVWCLVYAATRAGILTDAQATQWGLRYLSPHDANIPALVSGIGTLPHEQEQNRGKGAEYLKASKIRMLSELINHASPEQVQRMQHFMHEGRTKFFSQTVAVEGERAGWGDPEARNFYAAHSRNNPTEGWLRRANESFGYYHPDMGRALQQAATHGQPQHPPQAQVHSEEPSLLGSIVCGVTGFMCQATAKPTRGR